MNVTPQPLCVRTLPVSVCVDDITVYEHVFVIGVPMVGETGVAISVSVRVPPDEPMVPLIWKVCEPSRLG
jgi:hypothetical protein